MLTTKNKQKQRNVFQDRVYGRVNSYYTFVGGENFYTPYEVKVAAFNGLGDGPNSTVFVIMSAEDC